MSSAPDQNPAAQAMLLAGNAMAQGASLFLSPQHKNGPAAPDGLDPSVWTAGSRELLALQKEWMDRHAKIWLGMLDKPAGQADPQVAKPEADDKPGEHPTPAQPPMLDYLQQSYLVNADCLKRAAEAAPVPEGPAKDCMRALTGQLVDAMAPSNFPAFNVEPRVSDYAAIRDELQSGDIIVASKGNMKSFDGFLSLAIRIGTASSYSHVGVVVKLGNRCFVVEATPPVVRLYPLSKLDSFYVIKMDQRLSREDENRLFEYVGQPYSDWNSVFSYFTRKPLANGKLQCAQLVSSFYNWPNLLRPEEIVKYTQEVLGKRMVFVR